MSVLQAFLIGVLFLVAIPASSAPICILNLSGQELLLVVDDLAGLRDAKVVLDGDRHCLAAADVQGKAMVSVFSSRDALEGCSRITRPGQLETLVAFKEFDNCRWKITDRKFE